MHMAAVVENVVKIAPNIRPNRAKFWGRFLLSYPTSDHFLGGYTSKYGLSQQRSFCSAYNSVHFAILDLADMCEYRGGKFKRVENKREFSEWPEANEYLVIYGQVWSPQVHLVMYGQVLPLSPFLSLSPFKGILNSKSPFYLLRSEQVKVWCISFFFFSFLFFSFFPSS